VKPQGRWRAIITPCVLALERRQDITLIKALARAFRYQRLLDEGRYASISEMAAAERIERGYLGALLRLTLLAPDLVELILDGQVADRVALPALLGPVPLVWAHQREHLMSGKPIQRAKLEVTWRARDCDVASNPNASRASACQCGRRL